MTATDNLKSALSAWVDETETNILGLKSGLGSVDATVSALQTELASGQADVANIKNDIASLKASVAALTPAPVDSPPPAPVPDPAKVFVVLDPGCDGTGTFTFAESGASQQPTFTWLEGDWKGVFVDETHYQMYQPDGKLANQYTYALGAMYGNSNGSLYFILNGSGFKAGNTFTVTVRQPKTWAELAEANNLQSTPDGTINKAISGDYPQDFRAVLVLAEYLGYPDAKAALDRWDAQIVANFPLRDRWSFARKAA